MQLFQPPLYLLPLRPCSRGAADLSVISAAFLYIAADFVDKRGASSYD